MSIRRILFTKTYNHRWPSRAVTEFQVTGEPITVKQEVAEAAIAKGYATAVTSRAKRPDREKTKRRTSGRVAGPDSGPRGAGLAASGSGLGLDDGAGRGAGVPDVPGG